jgi:hypothetical protein
MTRIMRFKLCQPARVRVSESTSRLSQARAIASGDHCVLAPLLQLLARADEALLVRRDALRGLHLPVSLAAE